MCACTESVRTGIGAVCVEYGRPKWPITMLNHTHPWYRIMFCFLFLAPYAINSATRYEEAFFSLENQGKKVRFARAPHDYYWLYCIYMPSDNEFVACVDR